MNVAMVFKLRLEVTQNRSPGEEKYGILDREDLNRRCV